MVKVFPDLTLDADGGLCYDSEPLELAERWRGKEGGMGGGAGGKEAGSHGEGEKGAQFIPKCGFEPL